MYGPPMPGSGLLGGMGGGSGLLGMLGNFNPQAFSQGMVDNQGALMGLASGILGGQNMRQGLGQGLANFQQGRAYDTQRNSANQTQAAAVAYAQKNGFTPQQIEMVKASKEAQAAVLQKMFQGPKAPIEVSPGASLVSPDTYKPIFTAPAAASNSGPAADYKQRVQIAAAQGMQPGTPEYNNFVMYGKPLKEGEQPITATDKQAILSADEMVNANQQAIEALHQAQTLSPKAYAGFGAGARAWLGNNLPDGITPNFIAEPEASQATSELDNAVVSQALAQLKTVFGGNPTEGERKIMLDLQGSSSQPDNVRKAIYKRAEDAARARLAFNKQKADALRGGTYYKTGGAPGAAGVQSTTDPAAAGAGPAAVSDPAGIR